MRLILPLAAVLSAVLVEIAVAEKPHALFIRNEILRNVRQGTLREYLPPYNTQKPRPFETIGTTEETGYPAAGITPLPPFTLPGSSEMVTSNEIAEGGKIDGKITIFPGTGPTQLPTGKPGFATAPPPGFTTGPPTGYTYPRGKPEFPTVSPPKYSTTQQPEYVTGRTEQTRFTTGFPTQQPEGFTTKQTYPTSGYSTEAPGYTTAAPGYSTVAPGYSTGAPGYSTVAPGYSTGAPAYSTATPGYSTEGETGVPAQTTPRYTEGTPSPQTYPSSPPGGYPTSQPAGFTTGQPYVQPGSTGLPTQQPGVTIPEAQTEVYSTPGFPTPGRDLSTPNQPTRLPISEATPTQPPQSTEYFTSAIETSPGSVSPGIPTESPEINTVPTGKSPESGDNTGTGTAIDEDLKHPPHIHAIDVQCGKEMMTINIEFNRQFDGIIYSKGFYSNPDCRYVQENSGQTKYSFTVSLNTCGTEFVNAFDTEGQSYLQNVLVIQNEAGIQEVWDVIRSVRCLWEGSLKDTLSVALSVGMLTQEIVTFSGDTAMARLDIQLGKGPFAPPADGLVKIGEIMTLAVSVSGDPGFDIQVKDCRATDSSNTNIVPLTDENGCVLKPKLFGSFQKTRETGSTGASIIAYAFFNAFKFPDVMDLMIECNIELCKTDCEVCPNPGQIEPGRRRRRRDLSYYNQTQGDGVTMGKQIRVILPEDLSDGKAIINLSNSDEGICISTQNFVFSSAILISLLVSSSFFSVYLWLQNKRLSLKY